MAVILKSTRCICLIVIRMLVYHIQVKIWMNFRPFSNSPLLPCPRVGRQITRKICQKKVFS